MAEFGNSSGGNKKKDGFTPGFRDRGGMWGLIKRTPGSAGGAVKEILVGRKRNNDPAPPDNQIRRDQFVYDVDNKQGVVDEHGRRKDYDKREDMNPKLEKVYPSMEAFWRTHAENLCNLRRSHPDLFNDKSSYLYHQWLQVRTFLTDAGPNAVGQIDENKIKEYFQTADGYNETMRYMEEEAFRIECANNIVEITKNGYKPGGLDAVNLGLITPADRLAGIARLGTGVVSSVEALLLTVYFMKTWGALVPSMLAAVPAALLTTMGPWLVGGAVAAIPFAVMINRLDQLFKTGTPEQLMLQCNSMIQTIQRSSNYAGERAYLRGMYGIDPGELRVPQPIPNAPLGTPVPPTTFALGGITTGGWEGSKKQLLKIKEARRIFYDQVMDIPEQSMFGLPEEAFIDNQGNYRSQVTPEGEGVKYQQEVWSRFEELGGHFIREQNSAGAEVFRRLTAVESLSRFQQARREVIMGQVQVKAELIINSDRQITLNEQEKVLGARKALIDKQNGQVRTKEKEQQKKNIALATDINEGKDGKPGLNQYAEEWKGTTTGSAESRLKGVMDVRQEVYDKVSLIIPFTRPVGEISVAEIAAAIKELKDKKIGIPSKKGTLENKKKELVDEIKLTPPKVKVGVDAKKGDIMADNPELERLRNEHQRIIDEIDKVRAQITELQSLSIKLQNERAKYDPSNEHGKAFVETFKKMSEAYAKLVDAGGRRDAVVFGPAITAADVSTYLGGYPGSFSVLDAGGAVSLRSGMSGLMTTLANEAKPPLWNEDENEFHEHRMTVIYAVAYARAIPKLDALAAAPTSGAKEYIAGGATIAALFQTGLADGKFNELTLLASNPTELAGLGVVGGVDMLAGDNVGLRAYAQARNDILTKTIEELVLEHDRSKQVAVKQEEDIDKKYDAQESRYQVLIDLIKAEKGADQSAKVSSQVFMRGLTGIASVTHLTDRRVLAFRSQLEQDIYLDYEKEFMLQHPDFPPAMLEFLDVVFQFRKNTEGKEELKIIYDLLIKMSAIGNIVERSPQIMLADIIYQSTPGIQEMLNITRNEGISGQVQGGPPIGPTWDQIVLQAFQNRQIGYRLPVPPVVPQLYRPCQPHPYSTTEMNNIFLSIQHMIIEKAANNGVVATL
ncbi:hypothetical protein KBB12_00050 [Candidatus Woesebacteria bacterium]|nr:hypothetical protein [Candidatus Woesebacteria bacterium]